MERECDYCGTKYSRPPSLIGRYCSKRCGYDARKKDVTKARRMVYAPDHPLAGSTGLVSQARINLYAAIGPGAHHCHWCSTPVEWKPGQRLVAGALVVDHVDDDWRNDDAANLVQACQPCNRDRRTSRVLDHEIFIVRPNGTRLRAARRSCLHCGSEFLASLYEIKKGNGRYCSKRCGYDARRG